jgi:4-hydroxybenzoate polyprenyltransferase
LLHFGRELQKDAEDFAGDYDVKINTVATVWGVHFTCNLAAIPLLILAVVVMVPYYSGAFGAIYTGIIGIGVWPMLFYATFVPLGSYSESELRRTTALLKAIMPIGLIAVLLGYQGY